jgi:uncharacterized coiled-coil protein SlyX
VADDYQSEIRVGQPIVPPRKRNFGLLGALVGLVAIAAAGVFVWMNYDQFAEAAHWGSSTSPPAVGADEASDLAKELRAFQQQTTEALGSTRELLEAQQSELKALSGQIADLTAKIDRIQPAAVAAPSPLAAPPAPLTQPVPPRPPQAAPPARAAVTAPRKRPAAVSRPEGAISVGGAPLPTPGSPAR